jgi:hypothetical protein
LVIVTTTATIVATTASGVRVRTSAAAAAAAAAGRTASVVVAHFFRVCGCVQGFRGQRKGRRREDQGRRDRERKTGFFFARIARFE